MLASEDNQELTQSKSFEEDDNYKHFRLLVYLFAIWEVTLIVLYGYLAISFGFGSMRFLEDLYSEYNIPINEETITILWFYKARITFLCSICLIGSILSWIPLQKIISAKTHKASRFFIYLKSIHFISILFFPLWAIAMANGILVFSKQLLMYRIHQKS